MEGHVTHIIAFRVDGWGMEGAACGGQLQERVSEYTPVSNTTRNNLEHIHSWMDIRERSRRRVGFTHRSMSDSFQIFERARAASCIHEGQCGQEPNGEQRGR